MIYFDNSATTPIIDEVLTTYDQACKQFIGNPSSLHDLGTKSFSLLTKAREQIAEILDKKSEEIIFTSGGTEGNNMIMKGVSTARRMFGKHILVSSIEHPSVLEPAKQLKDLGFDIEYIAVTKDGIIDLDDLKAKMRKDTILVSIMAINNEIGTCQPIKEVCDILKDYSNTYLHVDAVQAVGKINHEEYLLDRVNFATFSGHKFHAPRGVGFIYKQKNCKLDPLLAGGGQEFQLRSGTENIAGIAAMSKAFRLSYEHLNNDKQKMIALNKHLINFLQELKKVTIFSNNYSIPEIITFGIQGIKGEVLLHALEEQGIYVSTTSACSSHKKLASNTLEQMKVADKEATTAIRLSLSYLNTEEEIKKFINIFSKVYQKFDLLKN